MTAIAYLNETSESDLDEARPAGGTWKDYVYAISKVLHNKQKNGKFDLYGQLSFIYFYPKDLAIVLRKTFTIDLLIAGDPTFQHRWLMHTTEELPYGYATDSDGNWTTKIRTIFSLDRTTPDVHSYSSPYSSLVEESKYFFTKAIKGVHSGTCVPLVGETGWSNPNAGSRIPAKQYAASSLRLDDTAFIFDTLTFLKTLVDPIAGPTTVPYVGHDVFAWHLIKYWINLRGAQASVSGQISQFFTVPHIYAGTNDRPANIGKWVLSHLQLNEHERWQSLEHYESSGFWSQTGTPVFRLPGGGFDFDTSDFNHISFDMEEYLRIALEGTNGVTLDRTKFEQEIDFSDPNDITFTLYGETITGAYQEVTNGSVTRKQIVGFFPKTGLTAWASEMRVSDSRRNFSRLFLAESGAALYDTDYIWEVSSITAGPTEGLHTISGFFTFWHQKGEVGPPNYLHTLVTDTGGFKYDYIPTVRRSALRVIQEHDQPVHENGTGSTGYGTYKAVFPGGTSDVGTGTRINKFDNTDANQYPLTHEFFLYNSAYVQIGYCSIIFETSESWSKLDSYVNKIINTVEICSRNNGAETVNGGDLSNLQSAKDDRLWLDAYFAVPGRMVNDWMSYSMLRHAVNRINFVTNPLHQRYFFDFRT